MIIPKLALRNLVGAGLRTWLNVVVLSLSFVLIVFSQGLLEGMNRQAEEAMIAAEIGGGHVQHPVYDPFDPLTLIDAHGPVPPALARLAASGRAAPVLVIQGTLYPQGRLVAVQIKGIDPAQQVVALPTAALASRVEGDEVPLLIGGRMAQLTGLAAGDRVPLQWRDAHGTFDAREAIVAHVMKTSVQSVDLGQVWVPLARLHEMTGLDGEASFVVLVQNAVRPDATTAGGWRYRGPDEFLADLRAMVRSKSIGSSVLYLVFLALAMLAIFDTQVLAIFHRRREMGTLMALGFTRGKVIGLFTFEGMLHGVLAALVAALYGIPLLSWMARTGWALPADTDSYGFAIGERLYPAYGVGLVAGTTILVLLVTTIVSFLPTRRIATLEPTEALRGRLS